MELKICILNKRKLVLIPIIAVLVLVFYRGNFLTKKIKTSVYGKEARHVAFIKLHKTGSSTVQNIFLRFGVRRDLTFLLSSVTQNECGGAYHCISFKNTLSDINIAPPPPNTTFEIVCSHVIYNKKQFNKYLPKDTRYISILREPISRLTSAIEHFQLLKDVELSDFANNPFAFDHYRLNNGMAFELGFPQHLFPKAAQKKLDMKQKLGSLKYIDQIVGDFALLMINERFDESLVLLKRTLNWQTKDILYMNQVVSSKPYRRFKEDDHQKLRSYLALDYMLYENAVNEFEDRIQKAGYDFQKEVAGFQDINTKVTNYCAGASSYDPKPPLVIRRSNWHAEFSITLQHCTSLMRKEQHFFELIRVKQYGIFDIV